MSQDPTYPELANMHRDMCRVVGEQVVENERLREAHRDIIRKYEKIMGDAPEWTNFKPDDERLKFAREAWFGAAQIARNALKPTS